MAGPLPNFHVANTSPPILLNYYLLKSIFHHCCPRPSWGDPLGSLFPGSYMIAIERPTMWGLPHVLTQERRHPKSLTRNGLDANCKRFIRERPVHWGQLVSHAGVEKLTNELKGFIKTEKPQTPGKNRKHLTSWNNGDNLDTGLGA